MPLLGDQLDERIAHLAALAHAVGALVRVEPLVGELQGALEVGRLGGQERGAARAADREPFAVVAQRQPRVLQNPGRLGRPREDAELVAAHAIGGGLGADHGGGAAAEALEQGVARGVPERVVVGLEAVEVVEAEGERPPAGIAQRSLDVAVELAAVAEPRERVVRRLVLVQPRLLVVARLGELALGDVLEHGDRVVALAVRVPLGGRGDAHPDHLAVLAEAALLELVGVQRAVHDGVELAEVLLDVVGVRVLLELHLRELGGGVAEHRLERRIHLDDLARAITRMMPIEAPSKIVR